MRVLAAIGCAGILGRLKAVAKSDEVSDSATRSDTGDGVLLRVSLHPPEGGHYKPDAEVVVTGPGGAETLKRASGSPVYESRRSSGTYLIEVNAPGYRRMQRRVVAERGLTPVLMYLGKEGWPSYFMGGVEVPFEPKYRLAAVAFLFPPSNEDIARALATLQQFGLRRKHPYPSKPEDLDEAGGQIIYIEPDDAHPALEIFASRADQVMEQDLPSRIAAAFLPHRVRVGVPISTRRGAVRILDPSYTVQFRERHAMAAVSEIVTRWNADLKGRVDNDVATWRIKFRDAYNFHRHLSLLAEQVERGVLVYAEPSILFQLKQHACLPLTLDPCFSQQKVPHFARQRIPEAWCYIKEHASAARQYGHPSICIATLDEGITYSSATGTSIHPDVNSARIAECFDLRTIGNTKCTGDVLDDVHGMAVYGIIGARSNNHKGIAGIASNTTHLPVRYWSLTDTDLYRTTLQWLGGIPGIVPSSLDFDYVADVQRLAQPADVINCSHGWENHPIDTALFKALKLLATCGRAGKGTVVVYSAGNDSTEIQGVEELAASPYVIAVGNTYLNGGAERRFPSSNYGAALDLCAMGQDGPTLHPDPTRNHLVCSGTPPSGAFRFYETSAAAPVVSATAGLMLSVRPMLTRQQVREILCRTAHRPGHGVSSTDLNAEGGWDASLIPFNAFYGHGRVNAEGAVQLAMGYFAVNPTPCR